MKDLFVGSLMIDQIEELRARMMVDVPDHF
jgi:hypothetical protein